MLKNFYKKYLKKGDTIIIGCSGGPDSIYLTHLSNDTAKNMGFKIILAHLNHGLRAKDSQQDSDFVKELGEVLSLKTVIEKQSFKSFSEDKGRQARREFFERIRQKEKAKYIVLAHHEDDNIETIMMNFIRGAGLKGLSGMSEQSKYVLRPLLQLKKKDILAYLKKHKIKYREDKSNKDLKFTRNFYRNVVIPSIKKKNPNLNENLSRTAETFKEIENFLNKKATNWLKSHGEKGFYDLVSFRKQESALQKSILRMLYKKTKGDLKELESKHLEEVLKLLMTSHSGKHKNLGKHTTVKIQAKKFTIQKLKQV